MELFKFCENNFNNKLRINFFFTNSLSTIYILMGLVVNMHTISVKIFPIVTIYLFLITITSFTMWQHCANCTGADWRLNINFIMSTFHIITIHISRKRYIIDLIADVSIKPDIIIFHDSWNSFRKLMMTILGHILIEVNTWEI